LPSVRLVVKHQRTMKFLFYPRPLDPSLTKDLRGPNQSHSPLRRPRPPVLADSQTLSGGGWQRAAAADEDPIESPLPAPSIQDAARGGVDGLGREEATPWICHGWSGGETCMASRRVSKLRTLLLDSFAVSSWRSCTC